MGADEPESVGREEARQELRGRSSAAGVEVTNILLILVAIGLAAIAANELHDWAELAVLAAIVVTVIGFMIAISPNRRA